MSNEQLGPKPDAEIEPGEPNPGGADAVIEADGVGGDFAEQDPDIRDLHPKDNPGVDDALPDEVGRPDAEEDAEAGEAAGADPESSDSDEGADDEIDPGQESPA